MKLIVAGSRSIVRYAVVSTAIHAACKKWEDPTVDEIVSGMARGVDTLAVRYANINGIPVKAMPADWKGDGRSAGYKRNVRMAEYADALVAIWDGVSVGTKHMVDTARARGLLVAVYLVEDKEHDNALLC